MDAHGAILKTRIAANSSMLRRHWILVCVTSSLAAGLLAYRAGNHVGETSASKSPALSVASSDAEEGGAAASAEEGRAVGAAGRSRGTSLPPPDAPLKDTFSELQARASAGDRIAATRLYRNLDHCRRLRDTSYEYARTSGDTLEEDPAQMSADELDNYQAQLEAIETTRSVLGKRQEACAGVSDAMYGSLVSDVKRAAELGDADARACYLSQGPTLDMRSSINRPEIFQEYRDSVRSMVDAGLAAGDWKVVSVLVDAYQPGSSAVLGGVLGSDAYSYYRYLKLYRMGSASTDVDKLDRQLTSAAADLSPAQIADADAWAHDIFQRDFQSGSAAESVASGWSPCRFPQE